MFIVNGLPSPHYSRNADLFTKPALAGDSIKPGASAPGHCKERVPSLRSRRQRGPVRARLESNRLPPVTRADVHLHCFPGARAPGFMLSPATQAEMT